MGKRIDKLLLWGLFGLTGFICFLFIFGNIGIAMILDVLAAILLKRLLARLLARYSKDGERNKRRHAAHLLGELRVSKEPVLSHTLRLICKGLGFSDPNMVGSRIVSTVGEIQTNLCLLRRHPKGRAFDANDLLEQVARTGESDVTFLILGRVDESARSAAKELSASTIRIFDESQISAALTKVLENVPPVSPEPRIPIRERMEIIFKRVRPVRCMLYGLLLLCLYWMTGILFYLPTALVLLSISAVSLRQRRCNG